MPPLGLIGELDEYKDFNAVDPDGGIGNWRLEAPADAPQSKWLAEGRGIVVFREGFEKPIFSGPITGIQKSWEASEGGFESLLEVTGKSDEMFLAERLAWTNPSEVINLASKNVRWPTDLGWLNAGELIRNLILENTAGHPDRHVAKLYVSREDILLLDDESSKSTLLRFNQIDTEAMRMASVYGFRIKCRWHPDPASIGDGPDEGPGPGLLVEIEPAEDLTNTIQFGPHLGNLQSFSYSVSAPTATRAVLGAQHRKWTEFEIKPTYDQSENVSGYTEVETQKEGPERYYAYYKNDLLDPDWWGDPEETPEDMQHTLEWAARGLTAAEATWGVTAERLLDQSSTDWQWVQDPAQPAGWALDPPVWSKQHREFQEAVEQFHADNGPSATISFEPVETPESYKAYQDYDNGDLVRFHVDGEVRDEMVREIQISASSDSGHRVVPMVGSDGAGSAPYLYRQVRSLWNQVRDVRTAEDLVIEPEPVPVPAFGFRRVEED